jgi:hypothetical protein
MTLHKLRHHLPDAPQDWAVTNVRDDHTGALYLLGEYTMFVLLWRIQDHNAGLVARCSQCFTNNAYSEVYKQTSEHNCEHCLNTTFEGGFRAKIIRPALWDFGEDADQNQRRGVVSPSQAAVQSTFDFRMDVGDFMIRADGTRWTVQSLSSNHLRTGFAFPLKSETVVGFNYGNVRKEDPASVAFTIEPVRRQDVSALLDVENTRFPRDWSANEIIRMPLVDILDGPAPLEGFPDDFTFPSDDLYPDNVSYP